MLYKSLVMSPLTHDIEKWTMTITYTMTLGVLCGIVIET